MGQLFMMGFDGTSVNPQIRSLIENYHLGAVLLSAKNLKCIFLKGSSIASKFEQSLTRLQRPRIQPDWFWNYRPLRVMQAIPFRY